MGPAIGQLKWLPSNHQGKSEDLLTFEDLQKNETIVMISNASACLVPRRSVKCEGIPDTGIPGYHVSRDAPPKTT